MLCSVIEHGMKLFRFQTVQKNSASLRSSVLQFENSVTSYRALLLNNAHAFLCFNYLLLYSQIKTCDLICYLAFRPNPYWTAKRRIGPRNRRPTSVNKLKGRQNL